MQVKTPSAKHEAEWAELVKERPALAGVKFGCFWTNAVLAPRTDSFADQVRGDYRVAQMGVA